MAKQESKTDKLEREYVIPLRCEWKKVPRYRRAEKAIKAIREFLVRHMKIRDRDLKKIRIDKYLNEEIWFRGIKKPPAKIKVKAIKETDSDGKEIVRVELINYSEKAKFKRLREEKIFKEGEEKAKKKKEAEKPKEEVETKESEEKKEESEEKKAAVVEAGEKIQKAAAKKVKHDTGAKIKQPKHQKRVALAK